MKFQFSVATLFVVTAALAAVTAICAKVQVHPPVEIRRYQTYLAAGSSRTYAQRLTPAARVPNGMEFAWRLA